MLVEDRGALALEPQTAPRAASLLLHLLAVALLVCIAAGATFYLYWAFNNVVSTYRRHMNAAAYDAQLFFGQRESLLRSISASAIRNIDGIGQTPLRFRGSRQIKILALRNSSSTFNWALVLTQRDLQSVKQANTNIIFVSPRDASMASVTSRGQAAPAAIPVEIKEWLTQALTRIGSGPLPQGEAQIVWLHPPQSATKRLYLFTPLDIFRPDAGWIGLEVHGAESAVDMTRMGAGNYVLFDQKNRVVLQSPDAGLGDPTLARITHEDAFGLRGQGWLPDYLVLSKSISVDGWRLVYYTPITNVLHDNLIALRNAAIASLLLIAIVILQMRYIRRHLVMPARHQYEALADSVSLNQKLIQVAPVGLCLLRRSDGAVVLSNDMARRWFQGTPGWRSKLLLEDAIETGREHHFSDGRSAYLTFALTTYQGESVMLCGISDISALKQVEQSLLQAKRDAEAANQAKTAFLATMSHEIRTPLYGMLGTLELFSLTQVSSQQAQYLETVQQSSATLLRTINDTLDLSRIEAGRTVLEYAPFSPVDLLHNVVASFAARAQAKGLRTYAVAAPEAPASVIGDNTRIRQILDNLVSNAIKFTDAGQVVLRLNIGRRTPEGVSLCFQVADTGAGIAPEHQERLFEPYYRVDADNTVASHGTGLGLSICRSLSDMMNGRINAVSEPGLGTSITFEIRLPPAPDKSDTDDTALEDTAIYVQGAVPEIVNNLSGWLRRWGAVAHPLPVNDDALDTSAVLVHAWPHVCKIGDWQGAQVIVHPPGQRPNIEDGPHYWFASAYDLAGIKHAIRLAQRGLASDAPLDPKETPETLALRVLVAEDNPISQLILREQLEHLGCTVVLVGNGHEAMNLPDLLDFDVVLTDLNMPAMDGYELTRMLRIRGYDRPILGVTANAFPHEQQRAMNAGMTSLLVKPLALSALHQMLQAVKVPRD
ncbi:ATP-binding protein [Achromobacter pestifer]|nr:ATP-binding protein [Achromobacter pestifer]